MAHRASRNFAALFRYARASSRFNQCPPGARYRTFASPSGRSRDPVPLRSPLDRPDATRGFFPLACSTLRGSRSLADRDANHSIIALPRGARIKPVQPPPPPSSSSWYGRSLLTRKSRLSLRDPIESGTEAEGNAVCRDRQKYSIPQKATSDLNLTSPSVILSVSHQRGEARRG